MSPPIGLTGEKVTECVALLHRLGPDSLQLVLELLRGMVHGQRKYGPLEVATDGRDFEEEALEELRDTAVYLGAAIIRRRWERR